MRGPSVILIKGKTESDGEDVYVTHVTPHAEAVGGLQLISHYHFVSNAAQ